MTPLICGGSIETITIPLKHPFITALGQKHSTTNIRIQIHLKGGFIGSGEASTSIVLAHHRPQRLRKELTRMLARFHGRDIRSLRPLSAEVWQNFGHIPAAASAFECATTDAYLKVIGLSWPTWLGGKLNQVETDCTISATSLTRTLAFAKEALNYGFRKFKVKIGLASISEELERLDALSNLPLPKNQKLQISIDGNGCLGFKPALALVEACLKKNISLTFLEQPLARHQEKSLARLKSLCPIPIAVDESVGSVPEALKVLDLDAADILNIKVAKTGVQGSLDIIALAQSAKKQLMIGCMQETRAGLEPSVALACGTGAFEYIDLDSDYLLSDISQKAFFNRKGANLHLCEKP